MAPPRRMALGAIIGLFLFKKLPEKKLREYNAWGHGHWVTEEKKKRRKGVRHL